MRSIGLYYRYETHWCAESLTGDHERQPERPPACLLLLLRLASAEL